MIALKLAYRNLKGAGLRTWLNAAVLSLSFVVIIWHKGLLDGWDRQARRDSIAWELGGGQYWCQGYDPYDPFTIEDSHAAPSPALQKSVDEGNCTPILVAQASIYPEGRMQSVLLKGIDPGQQVLRIPTDDLTNDDGSTENVEEVPTLIGTRMASNNKLQVGEVFAIRWRDANGTFDAAEARVVGIFKTTVPTIDNSQVWVPLNRLRDMLQMPGEATIVVAGKDARLPADTPGWVLKDHAFLLAEMDEIIKRKSIGGMVLYVLLMSLAMLAIFDTQVLSVFKRRKEIGTNIALGMTRGQVIRLFTIEGAMHGILAAALAAAYGIPLLTLQVRRGFRIPQGSDDYGLAIAEKIIPVYSVGLVLGTTLLVMVTVTVVSFIPARRIARINPTDAIRGRLQ